MTNDRSDAPHVVIAGGGIAGIEALLAIHDLAGERVRVTLMSAEPEFTYLPELLEEPFTSNPARRTDLALAAAELGADFRLGGIRGVEPDRHIINLADGSTQTYSDLVIALGARRVGAYAGIPSLLDPRLPVDVDRILVEAARVEPKTLALLVPTGATWVLPIYEFALLARGRAEELGLDVGITVYTPEPFPLSIFGIEASTNVGTLLRTRRILLESGTHVRQRRDGRLVRGIGGAELEFSRAVALPAVEGPLLDGLPSDSRGFIPTDELGRVVGAMDVYAAGDATTMPIKQGGLACQQADVAALHIAAKHGAPLTPVPFRPVLRGKLVTGADSLFMRAGIAGGEGEGRSSEDALWRPAIKVAGRYLAPWLAHQVRPSELDVDGDGGPGPFGPRRSPESPFAPVEPRAGVVSGEPLGPLGYAHRRGA